MPTPPLRTTAIPPVQVSLGLGETLTLSLPDGRDLVVRPQDLGEIVLTILKARVAAAAQGTPAPALGTHSAPTQYQLEPSQIKRFTARGRPVPPTLEELAVLLGFGPGDQVGKPSYAESP